MYKSSNSVTSTLCYGVQWDATLSFISRKDSKYLTIIDDLTTYNENDYPSRVTGEYEEFKTCNIYDLAGGVREWTMEAFFADEENTPFRILRGGSFSSPNTASTRTAVSSSYNNSPYSGDLGCRVALYIK